MSYCDTCIHHDVCGVEGVDDEATTYCVDRIEPCEDCISRQAVEKITWEEPSYTDALNVLTEVRDKVRALPPITPQPKTEVLEKIRVEIEKNAYPIVHGVNNHEKGMTLNGILQIIDKYKTESEEV